MNAGGPALVCGSCCNTNRSRNQTKSSVELNHLFWDTTPLYVQNRGVGLRGVPGIGPKHTDDTGGVSRPTNIDNKLICKHAR